MQYVESYDHRRKMNLASLNFHINNVATVGLSFTQKRDRCKLAPVKTLKSIWNIPVL